MEVKIISQVSGRTIKEYELDNYDSSLAIAIFNATPCGYDVVLLRNGYVLTLDPVEKFTMEAADKLLKFFVASDEKQKKKQPKEKGSQPNLFGPSNKKTGAL